MRFPSPAIRAAAATVALIVLSACGEAPTAPDADLSGSGATLHSTSSGNNGICPGNSGGACDMSVSVLMTADSDAWLTVRTGGYDEATGDHDPNGTFEKVQYKIFNAKGKLVATKNSDASGSVYRTKLPGTFTTAYRVEVQANVKKHSGKKGTAVVRGIGVPAFLPDIDLSAESIEVLVGGERKPLSMAVQGVSNTYIVDFANLLTVDGAPSTTGIRALCVVSVDGRLQIPGIHPGFAYVGSATQYIAPGTSETCSFKLTLPSGDHTIKVTALAVDIFADGDVRNNSVTGTLTTGAPADLAVTRVERLVDGSDPVPAPALGEVLVGTTNTFVAWVASTTGAASANAVCSVTLNGSAIPADRIQWITQEVTVAAGATAECAFKLTLPDAGQYSLAVTATAPGDPNAANDTQTGDLSVRPAGTNDPTVDLTVKSVNRVMDGEIVPLGEVSAGLMADYVARIGVVAGGTLSSSGGTCSARITNERTLASVVVPGTVVGTASTTSDAECRFSAALASDGNNDERYVIAVTANPAGAVELTPENNTASGAQKAIVRVDLNVSNVQMIVDGQTMANTLEIAKGKTATYVVTFSNGSDRPATFTCVATSGAPSAPQLPIPVSTPGLITIGAGEEKTCTFSYTFLQIASINFVVTAVGVSPIDADLTNNLAQFQTNAKSDQTFPAIGKSNVHALQSWYTDGAGNTLEMTEQSVGVNRITLTFAATTAILGDFKLTGSVTSGTNQISSATFTALGLTPGSGGFASCRTGVDAGSASPANHALNLKICAQEVAGEPGIQAIYVEYSSVLQAPVPNPSPSIMFANDITFDVALDWTLFGASVSDRASAMLSFALQTGGTGFANSFQKTQTGDVTVLRNGGG